MDAPSWMFTKALSHRQKVLRLYKRALKECDNWYRTDMFVEIYETNFLWIFDGKISIVPLCSLENRYQKCVVRARFDEVKNEPDTRKGRAMLMEGCKELWEKHHPKPFECLFLRI